MLQRFAVSFKSRDSFSKGTLPLPFTDTHLCVTLTFLNNRSALMEGLAKAKVSSEGSGAGKKQEMRASAQLAQSPALSPAGYCSLLMETGWSLPLSHFQGNSFQR